VKGEIISVGSELLLGQIVNTNARFLSEQLAELGISVFFHTVVGDNPERLLQAIGIAEKRSDLIVFTGGLGPTKDDVTKEVLSSHLGVPLVIDEASLKAIEDYFRRSGRPFAENNRKQALVLRGAEILPNDAGMAPGMFLSASGKSYLLLPGPPAEMETMFLRYGKPLLAGRSGRIESRVLRFFGIGEAELEKKLEDLIEKQSNPTIAPLADEGEVSIRLTASHAVKAEREKMLDSAEKKILERVGPFFYGYGGTTIFREMGERLRKKGWTLAAAESLTGGMFQSHVSAVPGASAWFKGGVVTYQTETKTEVLNVKRETVSTFGVVSGPCAKEMAENVRRLFRTDVGISFTGVAGPDPLEGKDPGLAYIGLSVKGRETEVFAVHLIGNRDTVRLRSAKHGAWAVFRAAASDPER